MQRTIPPEMYKRMADQHKRLQKMSRSQFISWACSFYDSAHHDGFTEAEQQYTRSGINVSADIADEVEVYDADNLYDTLLSIRGIGPTLAARIMDAITAEGTDL